jgi:hypothetical protein
MHSISKTRFLAEILDQILGDPQEIDD